MYNFIHIIRDSLLTILIGILLPTTVHFGYVAFNISDFVTFYISLIACVTYFLLATILPVNFFSCGLFFSAIISLLNAFCAHRSHISNMTIFIGFLIVTVIVMGRSFVLISQGSKIGKG